MEEIMNAVAVLENVELQADAQTARRSFTKRISAFTLSDKDFVRNFRLSKILVYSLIDILKPFMTEPTRSSALDIPTKANTYILNLSF